MTAERDQPGKDDLLSVGETARRAGTTISALHFWERRGLITSTRTSSGHRRYPRHVLRRLAFIGAAQRVGLGLDEIAATLAQLPADWAPTQAEWTQLTATWRRKVDIRIAELTALRADLDGCIGCGCLSLRRCTLFNPSDEAALEGPGSRWLRTATTRGGAEKGAGHQDLNGMT